MGHWVSGEDGMAELDERIERLENDLVEIKKDIKIECKNEPKIEILWDSILEEVYGDESPKKVTGVKIKNIKTKRSD